MNAWMDVCVCVFCMYICIDYDGQTKLGHAGDNNKIQSHELGSILVVFYCLYNANINIFFLDSQ